MSSRLRVSFAAAKTQRLRADAAARTERRAMPKRRRHAAQYEPAREKRIGRLRSMMMEHYEAHKYAQDQEETAHGLDRTGRYSHVQ